MDGQVSWTAFLSESYDLLWKLFIRPPRLAAAVPAQACVHVVCASGQSTSSQTWGPASSVSILASTAARLRNRQAGGSINRPDLLLSFLAGFPSEAGPQLMSNLKNPLSRPIQGMLVACGWLAACSVHGLVPQALCLAACWHNEALIPKSPCLRCRPGPQSSTGPTDQQQHYAMGNSTGHKIRCLDCGIDCGLPFLGSKDFAIVKQFEADV